jgi:hypothetical protein
MALTRLSPPAAPLAVFERKILDLGRCQRLFFVGGLGVHNFYMGKVLWGLFYIGLTFLGWGLLIAGSSVEATDKSLASAGVLALMVLGIFLLWDLFTIPRQLKQRQECIEQELLDKLSRGHIDRDLPPTLPPSAEPTGARDST